MSSARTYGPKSVKALVTSSANLKGEGGSDFLVTAATYTGTWEAITALAAAVITVTGGNQAVDGVVSSTYTSLPLPAGATIFGRFTSIALASGKVIAYRAN